MVQQIANNGEHQPTLNWEELLQLGIQTAKHKNYPSARVMFQQVLNDDPRNERALLWMAFLSQEKTEKTRYLMKVLKVNPKNPTARQELQNMSRKKQVRANRTLIFGGVAIVALILVIILVVLGILLLTQGLI